MKKVFGFFLVLIVFASCSSDLDPEVPVSLDGKWVLLNVSCFCSFDEEVDFSTNSIEVNSINNEITIENTGDVFLGESGTYTYVVNEDEITFNNKTYVLTANESNLILNFVDDPGISDDEISYSYKRED